MAKVDPQNTALRWGVVVSRRIYQEKTSIRREITFFAKVSKMAIFRKIAKGGPREIFKTGRFFGRNSEG